MKIQYRLILVLVLLLSISNQTLASLDPIQKECIERGYSVDGDYCVFPDDSKCLLTEFNSGNCGSEWMTEDYCVEEGNYVWDEDRCCDGLYFKEAEGDEMSVCAKRSWIGMLIRKPLFWIILVLLWIPFELTIAKRIARKRLERKEERGL